MEGMALILWGLLIIGLVLTPGSSLWAPVTIGFVVIAPGLVVVRLLGIRGIARWILAVAVSLAVSSLLTVAMAYAGVWVPQLAIIGLAVVTIGLAGVPHLATWLDVVSEVPPLAAPSLGVARVRAAFRALEIAPAPRRISVPIVEPPPRPKRATKSSRSRKPRAPVPEVVAPRTAVPVRNTLSGRVRATVVRVRRELPSNVRVRSVSVLGMVRRLANGTIGPAVPSAARRVRLAADAVAGKLLADNGHSINAISILGPDEASTEVFAIAVSRALAEQTRKQVHLVQVDMASGGPSGGRPAPAGLDPRILMYEYFRSRRPLSLERHAVRRHIAALSEEGEWLVAYGSLDGAAVEVWVSVTSMAVAMVDRWQTGVLPEVARRLWQLGDPEVAAVLVARVRPMRERMADARDILVSPTLPASTDAAARVSTLAWVGDTLLPAPPGAARGAVRGRGVGGGWTVRPTPEPRPLIGIRRTPRD